MNPPNPDLDALREALQTSQRYLYRNRLTQSLANGFAVAVRLFAILAFVALIYVVIVRLIYRFDDKITLLYISVAAALACLGGIIKFVAGSLWKPQEVSAAERMDARYNRHNQIATSLDLLKRGDVSPMSKLAISDGLLIAESVKSRPPLRDGVTFSWRMHLAWLVITLLLWVSISYIPIRKQSELSSSTTSTFDSHNTATNTSQTLTPKSIGNEVKQDIASTPISARNPTLNPFQNKNDTADMPGKSSSSVGASGAAMNGKINGGDKASEEKPLPQPNLPQLVSEQAPSKPSSGSGMGAAASGSSTGGIGAAGKGGGGKSLAVENEARKQDAVGIDAGNNAGGDAVEPDENNENKHRGGAQPLMQDRRQAPTRELGMSGAKGSPGNGRGGPTPAKKARGAGALLLGVPMPDFVPGRLLAGTSKISRENTKPEESQLPLPAAADVAARSVDESIIHRFDIPLDDAELFRRYCDALYREPITPNAPTTQGVP